MLMLAEHAMHISLCINTIKWWKWK